MVLGGWDREKDPTTWLEMKNNPATNFTGETVGGRDGAGVEHSPDLRTQVPRYSHIEGYSQLAVSALGCPQKNDEKKQSCKNYRLHGTEAQRLCVSQKKNEMNFLARLGIPRLERP